MEDKSYFERLEEARQYSKEQIVNEYPWIFDIRGYINWYFTHTTDSLQHSVIDGANMQYQALLLGSFIEFIFCSMDIKASIIPEYDASWDIKFSRRLFRYGKDNDIMLLKGIYESLDEKTDS